MSKSLEYIDYNGRKVPTLKTLQKQGYAWPNGQIPNQITKVSDSELAIPNDYLDAIVWNLRKYSSYTYIERMLKLLEPFVPAFEKYNIAIDAYDLEIEKIQRLYKNIVDINEGLVQLKNGYKSGYALVRNATDFGDFFSGRLLWEYDYEPIGHRQGFLQSIGLFSWVEKAVYMSARVQDFTLAGRWHAPFAIREKDHFNLHIAPLAKNYQRSTFTEHFKTGQIIPKSGIWNPFSFKSGCPNYLWAGNYFPESKIAVERIYRPEYFTGDGDYVESWEDYNYEDFPAEWELLWEDNRYEDGVIPEEEAEYLDETTAFPKYPPEPY